MRDGREGSRGIWHMSVHISSGDLRLLSDSVKSMGNNMARKREREFLCAIVERVERKDKLYRRKAALQGK